MFRTIAVSVTLLAAATPASAASYSSLYVFGDSFVDSGALQALSIAGGGADPTPAAAGYFEGRFTNGYNYADQLSERLFGEPTKDFLEGGRNYAFGGARAFFIPNDPLSAIPTFAQQVGLYVQQNGLTFDPNALVLVSFNTNDLNPIIDNVPGAGSFQDIIGAQIAQLVTLNQLGARNFLIANAADIGIQPQRNGNEQAPTALAAAYNPLLVAAIAAAPFLPGTDVRIFDLFSASQAILADPAAFGLPAALNVDDPCQTNPAALSGCVDYGFLDPFHPTTAVQQVIGDIALRQVPAPAGLALFGLGALMVAARRR